MQLDRRVFQRAALLCSSAFLIAARDPGLRGAQGPAATLSGSWTASAGAGPILRGGWSAEVSPDSRDRGQGSWTLVSDTGEILMQGTWSARKSGRDWQGTWTARIANGQTLSGTWSAYLPDFSGKTFGEMLEHTLVKQVAGSWQSGKHQGNWWLDGARPRPGKR